MSAQEVIVGLNIYQPRRRAHHRNLSDRLTDPGGIDWTKRIYHEAYLPQLQRGLLNAASFDILGTLHREIEHIDANSARKISRSMKEYGIGEPYLHPILPDLSLADKEILIGYGFNRFHQKTGRDPQIFWPPETAIDTQTLEVLERTGYRAFVCAPEQIIRSDRQGADNKPTIIPLSGNHSIIALPFDREVSTKLAFDPKINADHFVQNFILPALQRVPANGKVLAWTDDETFGHHNPGGEKFLQYLLFHALQNKGLIPVPVNEIIRRLVDPGMGRIRERTAWSCACGDLRRWHGECGCHGGGNDLSWKGPFYSGLHALNRLVTNVVERELGKKYISFLQENFETALENRGGSKSRRDLSLLSAKASSLAAVTSCGTFFDSPHTSGRINILMAMQALLHLEEAGLVREAESGREILRSHLRQKAYAFGDNSAHNPFNEILR